MIISEYFKDMAEVLNEVKEMGAGEIEKQFNDRSYNGVYGNESGFENGNDEGTGSSDLTNPTVESSGYESGKTAWEDFEGEIVNLSTFKLECLQSSNVIKRVNDCEISSIMHENGTPQLRKGNIVSCYIELKLKIKN